MDLNLIDDDEEQPRNYQNGEHFFWESVWEEERSWIGSTRMLKE